MTYIKRKKGGKDNFEVMVKEIAKYIEFHGGKAVVLGGISVSQRPPLKYNFTLHIDITGKPPKKI